MKKYWWSGDCRLGKFSGTENEEKNLNEDITGLHLVQAMACSLCIGTGRKIDPKDTKKGLKVIKKMCQKGVILVLLSLHAKRVSVSHMQDFWMASFRYINLISATILKQPLF